LEKGSGLKYHDAEPEKNKKDSGQTPNIRVKDSGFSENNEHDGLTKAGRRRGTISLTPAPSTITVF
jgi:hypothetical protein